MIKNLNNKIFLTISVLVTVNYIFFLQRIIFRQNPYITADWLINYQGGFVRRGMIGEIFFQLHSIIKIDILYIVFFFNVILLILFFYLIYNIIKHSLSNNIFLFYCLLPSTLLFTFFDPLAVGRKDYLVIIPYLFYAYFIEKLTTNIKIFLVVLFIIVSLTHELVFFFIPFLFIIKYLNFSNIKFTFKNFKFEIICSIVMGITIFFLFLFKIPHNNELCQSLVNLKLNNELCNGVIRDFSSPKVYSLDTIHNNFKYLEKFNYIPQYSIYIIITLLPTFVIIFIKNINLRKKKIFFYYNIISILSIFPLIFVSTDWGRYINILFILNIVYFHFFLKNIGIINFNLSLIKKIILTPFVFLYLTSWHMPHCCQEKMGSGYIYIVDRILFRINDESNETHKFGKDFPREILKKLINYF